MVTYRMEWPVEENSPFARSTPSGMKFNAEGDPRGRKLKGLLVLMPAMIFDAGHELTRVHQGNDD